VDEDFENAQLRAVALRNIETVLAVRRRAENELLAAQEALQRKSEELQLQREWFEVTLSSIGDAVITTDTEARVTFLNPVAEALTGWKSSEAKGQSLDRVFRIIDEDTRQPVSNPVAEVFRTSGTVNLANHTSLVARDGSTIAIEDSAAPIRDPRGNIIGAVMVFHDVTARRASERAVAEQGAALRENDRRKDEFLATLAHELRNPLAPIRQAALIAKAPSASEAQKRWSHDVINRQVHHMALLLDDLMDVSRITRGTLQLRIEPAELAAIVDAAVETARPAIDAKRHSLEVQIQPKAVRFMADPLRMAQVLSNLLINAAKYTDPGGHIRLDARSDGNTLSISVHDTGIGIPVHSLRDVFTMFSQVKSVQDRSEGGLGIGLALTKGLVELQGGSIEARSAGLGHGSEFTIHLPLRPVPATASESERTRGGASARKLSVLIADDNRDAAQSLGLLLQMEGHDLTMVHNGEQALQACLRMKPDVAVLDIGMPRLDGYEVARQIRRSDGGASIRLVAVTGWGQSGDKHRAQAAGFEYHFTKPIQPEKLIDLLRDLGRAPTL
jgi:PAS domain S-box-containing protein